MQKNRLLMAAANLLALMGFIVSCGGGGADLQKENATLKKRIVDMEQSNEALKAKVSALEQEIAQFTETPESMFDKAVKAKQMGSYDESLALLERLTAKAAGTPLVKAARDEAALIAKLKQEKRAAEDRARRETFQDIGGGFAVRKISFRDSHGITEIVGELKNNSGRNFIIAKFVVALYDGEGSLLSNSFVDFTSFPDGSVKTFSTYSDVAARKISNCKVQVDKVI